MPDSQTDPATTSVVVAPQHGVLRRMAPRAIASLLIAAGFVWALRRGGLPFAPPAQGLAELR
jgi:hypothetical protein